MTAPRIFISYARKDGFAPSQTLRQRLEAEGIEVWQDLIAMNIGENWQPQIFSAIEQAQAMVMVLTPEALKSPMVRQEWVHARRAGTPIFPVAFTDLYKAGDVPRWVGKVDAVILSPDMVGVEDKWQALIKQLRDPKPRRRVPNMVERLPNEYVERQALHREILSELLDEAQANPRHTEHTSRVVTVLGEGGFGKTILKQAVGLDIAVTEAFTGGVLFVTVGESTSQMFDKWNSLLKALTGSDQNVSDPINQLRLKLQGDDFLIILDDVWDKSHIDPILRLSRCTYLISTRDDGLAALATDHPVRVAEMTPEEARDVLVKYIPDEKRAKLTDNQRARLKAFGGQLGEWPLLLDIHGWAIREECQRGSDVDAALDYVQEGLREEGLDPFPRGTGEDIQRRTLAGSMNASLRRYSDDEKQRLYELAIFPDDTAIPQATVLQLWRASAGLSDFKAKALLRRIAGHFCRFRVEEEGGEPVVRFHDKIREYLALQIPNQSDLHRRLTDGWGDLYVLPDDYAWRNLAYHLIEGRQADRLYTLLTHYRWLQAKLAATDANALIADCAAYLEAVREGENWETVRLIRSALTMSGHVLDKDKSALAHQLVGRLMTWRRRSPTIHTLTEAIMTEVRGIYPAFPDSEYVVLNQAGGTLIRTLTGHTGMVNCVAVHTDDRRAVSASSDNTLRVWDIETGALIHILIGHTGWVNHLAVTPDGRRAVSASSDQTVRVWDLESGRLLHTLTGHTGMVNCTALHPDGRQAVSASRDDNVRVWNLETGALLHTLIGHTRGINHVALTPDGGRALSASIDKTVRVWDLESHGLLHTLTGHTEEVNHVAVTPDGRRAVSASHDKTVRVWDLETGTLLHTLIGHTNTVNHVTLTPDGRRALSASNDKTVRVWDLETEALLHTLTGHTDGVIHVALMSDGRRAVSASGSIVNDDNTVRVWDFETGALIHTVTGHTQRVNHVALTPDGRRAVSASGDKTVQMWELETGALIHTLKGHTRAVNRVALTPDGRRAVSASDDRTLRIWDLETSTLLNTLFGHTSWVKYVALTPDGRRVVSASRDLTVRVWDLETGALIHTLTGHTRTVNYVSLSLEGGRAVSASRDKTLRVWNLETGAALGMFDDTTAGRAALAQSFPEFNDVERFQRRDDHILAWDRERLLIAGANFRADARLRTPLWVIPGQTLVMGDGAGRVLFLCVRGGES